MGDPKRGMPPQDEPIDAEGARFLVGNDEKNDTPSIGEEASDTGDTIEHNVVTMDKFWGSVDPRVAGSRLLDIVSHNPAIFDNYTRKFDPDLIVKRASWARTNFPHSETKNEWFRDVVAQNIVPESMPEEYLDKKVKK